MISISASLNQFAFLISAFPGYESWLQSFMPAIFTSIKIINSESKAISEFEEPHWVIKINVY
jgi:hypothetical protein